MQLFFPLVSFGFAELEQLIGNTYLPKMTHKIYKNACSQTRNANVNHVIYG